jgi:hypothetical protein
VQSALARLTSAQTYIFNSVLSIFGKDIKENVRFLVTFSDGSAPLVLGAIKEARLPCQMNSNNLPCHQSFNNAAVYISERGVVNSKKSSYTLGFFQKNPRTPSDFFKKIPKKSQKSQKSKNQKNPKNPKIPRILV